MCSLTNNHYVLQNPSLTRALIPTTANPSMTPEPLYTGFTRAQLTEVCDLKNVKRGRLSELSGMAGATYHAGKSVWQLGKEFVELWDGRVLWMWI